MIKKYFSPSDNGSQSIPEAVLPQDRERLSAPTLTRAYTPEELRRGVVKGDWAIETVGTHAAVGMEAPFIKLDETKGRLYGNNGCNVLNGAYTYSPSDSTIRFSNLATTMRLCNKEGITDGEINGALDAARFYSLRLDDSQYYLTLFDASHEPLMTLMHQDFQFLNGTWKVTMISGITVDNPNLRLVIDVDEGRVHGDTGCNVLNGILETDMEAANSISFQSIMVTKLACPEPNFQTQLIVALEDASHARPVSADKVLLIDSQGRTVLQLERTTPN